MRAVVLLALLMGACVPKSVGERLTSLEARVAQLEARPGTAPMAPANEDLAGEMYQRANEQIAAGDIDEAQATLRALVDEHPQSRAAAGARRMLEELSIVGQPAGDLGDVKEWYQGTADLTRGRHLVVFFEAWCPHCQREVPLMSDRLAGRDASGLLLTRLTRSSTKEQVLALLADNDVQVPTAHEGGEIAERFGVRGIPAAAVVHDGEIVWRGHPARLEGELLDRLLPPL